MRRRLRSASFPLHRHSLPQLAIDGALVALAYVLAFQLRFDRGLKGSYQLLFERTLAWAVGLSLVVYMGHRLYGKWWRYSTLRDLLTVVQAVALATTALVAFVAVTHPVTKVTNEGVVPVGLPPSVVALWLLITLSLLLGARLFARVIHERPRGFRARRDARTVLIAGAGDGGRLVVREILRNPELGLNPIGFVDDDPTKRRIKLEGVRVLGTTGDDLPRVLDETEPDEVIIAIPSAPGTLRGRVVSACRARGIPVRTLPTVF